MPEFRPIRPTASSPAPQTEKQSQSHGPEDVSVRPMRLKILYSFDDENKTNCLARWPQPLDIRTAYLDENTQIGIIELKTCIQAIVSASPELVAKLGQDYTVYAYDYSEYETPLVGQGMLSWVLASSSSTPVAPAHQSRTIVTGRVCKNILGLFSSTSQETLEVKLRLVPVPTSLQSEYIESMKKYRDISQVMPMGFDPQAWISFLQANPNFLQMTSQSRSQSPATGSGQGGLYGIEQVQRLLSGQGHVQQSRPAETQAVPPTNRFAQPQPPPPHIPERNTFSGPLLPQNNTYSLAEAGTQLARPSSAASSVHSSTAPKRRGRPPKDKNATRGRGTRARKLESRQPSVDANYVSNDDRFEEGPNKKRAKVTQAEWSGDTNFGKQPESLRVAASTAASVRILQPTALRPGQHIANALEGPPREPTPIAGPSNRLQRTQLLAQKSSLRRESFASAAKSYASPYGPSKPLESAMTSPEASQAESSPIDIGSSPVFPDASGNSSPNLPAVPGHFDDSGFMSGSLDDLFEDDEMRPIDDEELELAAQYSKRPNLPSASKKQKSGMQIFDSGFGSDRPCKQGDINAKAAAQKKQIARNARMLSRTTSSGAIAPPQGPASDPVRPSTLNRSQTWSGNRATHRASDIVPAPQPMESIERPSSRNRKGSENGSGSGARRKQAIQSKLASSVAAGEMPPFCEHCGAIETPTWRKAWVKIHSGTPEHVMISEEEGGIIAWQALQTDDEGNICLYRIIKKSILKTDEGFSEVLLCNPCGLWLHTRKCMRPKEVWEKPQNGGDGKRRRGGENGRQKSHSISDNANNNSSDSPALHSDASTPADGGQTDEAGKEPQLPVMKHRRATSEQIVSPHQTRKDIKDRTAQAALERAIKSSPHKFVGSKQSPIQVEDLTPQPTSRILFPSPSSSHQARSKHGSIAGSVIQTHKQQDVEGRSQTASDQANKENCPPTESDAGLDQFFDDDAFEDARSTTPTPTNSTRVMILKTLERTPRRLPPATDDFFSSAAKALLHPTTTPKRTPTKDHQPLEELTPFTAHLNQLLSDANQGSPESSQNFDFPSLPSLHNTPGRHGRSMDFDFSQFDSQDLLSTDVPMPSSPPAWFGVYEDPVEHGQSSVWADYETANAASTPEDEAFKAKTPKTPGLVVDDNGMTTVNMQAMT